MQRARGAGTVAGLVVALAVCALLAGCSIIGFVGGMEESRRRHSTREVAAEYDGLAGKTFAVVVAADRTVQANYPEIVSRLTLNVSRRLRENAGAAGLVPAVDVLRYQAQNPEWVAKSPYELAEYFGVERLVYIDLTEYALNEPGNAYLWNGVASGSVGVIEADSVYPHEFAYIKDVTVRFPDETGMGPMQIPMETVDLALSKRFLDRTSWLFYLHEEDYYPEY